MKNPERFSPRPPGTLRDKWQTYLEEVEHNLDKHPVLVWSQHMQPLGAHFLWHLIRHATVPEKGGNLVKLDGEWFCCIPPDFCTKEMRQLKQQKKSYWICYLREQEWLHAKRGKRGTLVSFNWVKLLGVLEQENPIRRPSLIARTATTWDLEKLFRRDYIHLGELQGVRPDGPCIVLDGHWTWDSRWGEVSKIATASMGTLPKQAVDLARKAFFSPSSLDLQTLTAVLYARGFIPYLQTKFQSLRDLIQRLDVAIGLVHLWARTEAGFLPHEQMILYECLHYGWIEFSLHGRGYTPRKLLQKRISAPPELFTLQQAAICWKTFHTYHYALPFYMRSDVLSGVQTMNEVTKTSYDTLYPGFTSHVCSIAKT